MYESEPLVSTHFILHHPPGRAAAHIGVVARHATMKGVGRNTTRLPVRRGSTCTTGFGCSQRPTTLATLDGTLTRSDDRPWARWC
jgi:hypothetical protein